MTRSRLRLVAAVLLFAGAGCDGYACQWTDEPFPDPVQSNELGRSYPTDDGRFDVVLHADGEWPPPVGATALRIEATPTDEAPVGTAALVVDAPYLVDGDRVADAAPTVRAIGPGEWAVEDLALDVVGVWAVPIVIEQGDVDDSIELRVEVVDD